ncbi:MAG: PQQ-binding-like beta-propeller repeat protein, partial [Theionarchaea archaeon]|nr:PQQ-binding-like beta-propeller repeat protein [Theionarchaea archaeon]
MKKLLFTAVLICTIMYAECQDPCKWTDFLGDPQRTAYTGCAGPDTPVELWKVEMPGDFDTPPFIVGDTVLVLWKDSAYHPGKSKVIQLDLLTGEVLHQIETDKLFFKIFPVDDQVFGASGLELYIIDLESEESTFLASFSGKTFGGTLKYPVVLEDRIIFPTTPVVCLSRSDFSILWNLNQATSEKDTAPIHLAGDETMVVSLMYSEKGNQILAVNPETGSLTWKSKPFFAGRLALGSNAVYCGGECLRAFDRRGSKLWEVTPEETIVSNIVVGPDALYFADAANNLYRIGGDGNLIWKTKWEGDIMCTERGSILCCDIYLVGARDTLYCVGSFMDRGSQITAYRMEDGSILWTFHFEISDSMSVPPF